MVVACGASAVASPGGSNRREGSRSGETSPTNSANEDVPGVMKASGRRASLKGLLATLLDERLHEVLGVGLEDVVDVLEDRVDVLVELLLAFGDGVGRCWCSIGRLLLLV